MKKSFIIMGLAATSVMFGAPITPNGPWQQVTTTGLTTGAGTITSDINNVAGVQNTAYWNNSSSDNSFAAPCLNIGCFITGTGAWTGDPASPALANPVFLGQDTTGAAVAGGFTITAPQAGTTMLVELAGAKNFNWFGWYDASLTAADLANPANAGKWGIIYRPNDTGGATASFTPSGTFGLWFLGNSNLANGATDLAVATALATPGATGFGFFSQDAKNTGDIAGDQHFALFATSAAAAGTVPTEFWVGAEDEPLAAANQTIPGTANKFVSDKDYNDMVVHLRVVPEPGYYVLLSLGLAGLGLARRRFNKAS